MIVQTKHLIIVEYQVPDNLSHEFVMAIDMGDMANGDQVEEWLRARGIDPDGTRTYDNDEALSPYSVLGATVECFTDGYDEVSDNG